MKPRSSLSMIAGAALAALAGSAAVVSSFSDAEGPAPSAPMVRVRDARAETPKPPLRRAPPEQAAPSVQAAADARTGGGSPVLAALASRDEADLALLSSIERRLRGDVPTVVFELLDKREQGASQAELSRFIDDRLPRSLAVRLEARAWLRRVFDAPPPSAPEPPPKAKDAPLIRRFTRIPTRQ